MRISSRFLVAVGRSNEAKARFLASPLALGIVLSAATAAAQPAESKPADPPKTPATRTAATDEPLLPPASASATPPPVVPPGATPPSPARDEAALVKQGSERPSPSSEVAAKPSDVFAEDWWSLARPTLELHGYYRVRAELFHNFSLGRLDSASGLWPQPVDNGTPGITGAGAPITPISGASSSTLGKLCGSDPTKATACGNQTQAGANMRLRLNPEIHVSDNLRVMAQIDLLDNLVMGSTPEGLYYAGQSGSGYNVAVRGGYTPLGAFSTTQWAPVAGVNSTQNSITVKRVWGEYTTPFGLLRFGRMPDQWGLGMMYNAGDHHDSDWQTTVDRIMFVTGYKKWDLYVAGMWDFANEGGTSATLSQQQGQAYDLGQLDDLNQYGLMVMHKRDPQLQRLDLARGDFVINGGLYFQFRNQVLANEMSSTATSTSATSASSYTQNLVRRGYQAYIPNLWLQVLYRKFRFEAEAAMIYGSIENTNVGPSNIANSATGTNDASGNYLNRQTGGQSGWNIRQFGIATQSEYRAIEDRLRVQFGFGWASGDPDSSSLVPPASVGGSFNPNLNYDRTFSQFAFHPDYRIDLILFRNILQRVTGTYYFRPSVEYDFIRHKDGQKLGGGATVIWSRASEFIQTPGNAPDLGIELNGKIYYQSRDGGRNDDPNKMGGFFTSLEYGVLFPLGGLGYLSQQQSTYQGSLGAGGQTLGTSAAQTLRWYLGVFF